MKKILAVLFCVLMLTSCGEQKELGKGNVDITKPISETQQTKPLRLIRVNGNLYYDIQRTDNTIGRCGTADGFFEKTVGEYEIPKKDNQSNFETKLGYQSMTEDVIELIEGGFQIFRKLETDVNIDDYKYAYCLKDKMPNSEKEQEIFVLSKVKNPSFQGIMECLFSSELEKSINEDAYIIGFKEDDKWGIRMTATKVTPKGINLRFERFGGEYKGTLEYGEAYTLEKFDNGSWEKLVPTNNVWHEIAYTIPFNQVSEVNVNFEFTYGSLKKGTYRITKQITDFVEVGNREVRFYNAQFVIE